MRMRVPTPSVGRPPEPAPADLAGTAELLDDLASASLLASRLLLHPLDAPTAQSLRAMPLENWPGAGISPEARTAGRALAVAVPAPEDREALAALRREQARLLRGPGLPAAIPYESAYTDAERLLFQTSTMQVREAYAAHGLVPPRLHAEPDDHIGLELHFCAILAGRIVDALDSAREEEASAVAGSLSLFLTRHLLVFGFEVAAALRENAPARSLYAQLGELLEELLDGYAQWADSQPAAPCCGGSCGCAAPAASSPASTPPPAESQ